MSILICSTKIVGCGFVAEAADWDLKKTSHGTVETCPECGMFGMVLTDYNVELLTCFENEVRAGALLNMWRRSLAGSELYLEYIVSHVATELLTDIQKNEILSRVRTI